jgi:hypothetical protein
LVPHPLVLGQREGTKLKSTKYGNILRSRFPEKTSSRDDLSTEEDSKKGNIIRGTRLCCSSNPVCGCFCHAKFALKNNNPQQQKVNDTVATSKTPETMSIGLANDRHNHVHVHTPSQANIFQEVWTSSALLFSSRITYLLVLGPVALFGDATGMLGEAACFAFSGIALIPCAER